MNIKSIIKTARPIKLLAILAGVSVAHWAYAADTNLKVSEALQKAEKLADGPVLSVMLEKRKDTAVYLVEYLNQGMPSYMELDAKTGKQLNTSKKVQSKVKPQLAKALKVASKQLEGDIESVEFDTETGDYLLGVELEHGYQRIVLDGESFKVKALDRSFRHFGKQMSILGGDDIDIEVFTSGDDFPFIGMADMQELHSIPGDIHKELRKELAFICEQAEDKAPAADPAS
ncbi:MAG: PepSY domain-containing protein [Cellvibrionaceae bacterium]|nr:PepSY domain-containing protein [Cellvibrionaceae bacterium]